MPPLVELVNRQTRHSVAEAALMAAVRQVLSGEGISRGEVSLAVVDDDEMQCLNRQYLAHDYPTDVLSFVLDSAPGTLFGEIIVSSDTAAATAPRVGWAADHELLLYVIHGALHLCGYDDHNPADLAHMRAKERHYLAALGLSLPE